MCDREFACEKFEGNVAAVVLTVGVEQFWHEGFELRRQRLQRIRLRHQARHIIRSGHPYSAHELLNATWDEFDLAQGLWRIPGARMKMREDHVVPLSRQARAILAELHKLTGKHPWVFTSHLSFRKALGRAAVHNVFVRTGKALGFTQSFTAHGVRSTFSTIANDAAVRPDVIELCLAHQKRNASRRAYNRATLINERRELMQGWADMLDDLRAGRKRVSLAGVKVNGV